MREIRKLNANVTRLVNTVRAVVGAKPIHDAAMKYLMASADDDPTRMSTKMAKHKAIVARMLPKRASREAESPTARGAQQEQ